MKKNIVVVVGSREAGRTKKALDLISKFKAENPEKKIFVISEVKNRK